MTRTVSAKGFGIFVVSLLLGTLYAVLVGLISGPVQATYISWPIWVCLFWFLFSKFHMLRFSGFLAVVPVAIIGFELVWSLTHPGMNAAIYKTLDRSHYTPGLRAPNPSFRHAIPDGLGWGLKEILIGSDGFRADPDTGQGNPKRCHFALIGDSMIYGSGMPYQLTLGAVLMKLGIQACIVGVTGNSPIDYLATLKFVGERIDPGARIAFYLYAYNDFVSLSKYYHRGFLSLSNWLKPPFEWSFYYDQWRQGTLTYTLSHPRWKHPRLTLHKYKFDKKEPIKVLYPRDPAKYRRPKSLNSRRRLALQYFLSDLAEEAARHSWHVSIIIHPDDAEIYANFAQHSKTFKDLDPRRTDALKICKEYSFTCEDISRYIYERSIEAGRNPYLIDNRHFSVFGTRIVAEHFLTHTKRLADADHRAVN